MCVKTGELQTCILPLQQLLTKRSIWEVRSKKQVLTPNLSSSEVTLTEDGQNFTYSKIQLWVALDRALRLADKRNLPCPNRFEWLKVRDTIYEEIMERSWNEEKQVLPPRVGTNKRRLFNPSRVEMYSIRRF